MSRYRLSVAGLVAVLLSVSAGWSDAQEVRAAKPLSTQQRLQRLEDVEAIRELLVAYGRNFDKRDFTAYANLFAKDGVWVGGVGGVQSYQGPDAIRAMGEKGYPPSVFAGAYHIMSNFAIELTGTDTATAWSRWTFVVPGVHKEPVIFRGGYYEDAFVREDGRWKFKRRVVATDPTTTGP